MTDESTRFPDDSTRGTAEDLAATLTAETDARLARADAELLTGFPGEQPGRQPVHTVYVPADRFHADLAQAWGRTALAAVDDDAALFDEVAGDPEVVRLVRDKLAREPIEDVRIDFEDGYTRRGDDAEDADVLTAAAELARAVASGGAPPYRGIRFKSLEAPSRRRGIRTLTMFLSRFHDLGGTLDDFVVTLPKITSVDQVEAMVELTVRLEQSLGLAPRSVRFELQIETPQSILGPHGEALVAQMIHAGDARVTALHYGTYDYSAYCGIPAAFQSMEHPVADHAKLVMQAAAAGTGVRLSDGSTNVLPAGRRGRGASRVGAARPARPPVARARLQPGVGPASGPAADEVRRHLRLLPRGLRARPSGRLRAYLDRADTNVMDEPATARALADFVVRGVDCGAVSAAEVEAGTGLDAARLLALARPQRRT